jgi:hypothetical protein
MESKSSISRVVLILALIFVLGACIGSLGTYYWAAQHFQSIPHGRDAMVKQLTRDLELSTAQQDQLRGVLDDTGAKLRALYDPLTPQRDQIIHDGRDRIRAMLTAEQKPKYEEFVRQIDERRKKSQTH